MVALGSAVGGSDAGELTCVLWLPPEQPHGPAAILVASSSLFVGLRTWMDCFDLIMVAGGLKSIMSF